MPTGSKFFPAGDTDRSVLGEEGSLSKFRDRAVGGAESTVSGGEGVPAASLCPSRDSLPA